MTDDIQTDIPEELEEAIDDAYEAIENVAAEEGVIEEVSDTQELTEKEENDKEIAEG